MVVGRSKSVGRGRPGGKVKMTDQRLVETRQLVACCESLIERSVRAYHRERLVKSLIRMLILYQKELDEQHALSLIKYVL